MVPIVGCPSENRKQLFDHLKCLWMAIKATSDDSLPYNERTYGKCDCENRQNSHRNEVEKLEQK